MVGALGTLSAAAGFTALEAAEAALEPMALMASTVNV
jgi:hypothetical protein